MRDVRQEIAGLGIGDACSYSSLGIRSGSRSSFALAKPGYRFRISLAAAGFPAAKPRRAGRIRAKASTLHQGPSELPGKPRRTGGSEALRQLLKCGECEGNFRAALPLSRS